MTTKSAIEWTDSTWNPVRGCSRVSEGCQNCYAEGIARRFSGAGKPYEGLIHRSGAWNGRVHLAADHLLDPIRWGKGRRIFVNSMSDLFHEAIPFDFVDKVFAVMACTTRHTYQILTKRPQRMLEYFDHLRWDSDIYAPEEGNRFDQQLRWHGAHGCVGLPDQVEPSVVYDDWKPNRGRGGYDNCGPSWPLENAWLGVSCENQATADARIPILLRVPAKVRFLSCEPLLAPIALSRLHAYCPLHDFAGGFCSSNCAELTVPDWVIVGGESGPRARPMEDQWARNLSDACATAGIAFFMKQGSQANWPDYKNLAAFPEDLRVRQWPRSAA